jgi:cysteinyl-tRNA synthetase
MMLKIYNTLSRSIEEFQPIVPSHVGMYSCGPTVYDYQHIGHMRRYVGDDILIRVLKANGFAVHHVMNITDVGHLVSDSDTGEDKMEKGAKKFGLSVWDISKKFEKQFKDSCELLNIALPKDLMHATDYIPEQIELVKKLEEKGFTYKTSDGIYFDTSKFPDYFKLSRQNPEELIGGARVDLGEKKNISDFALWKLSPVGEKRQMEWESPWGVGFPGWHIECSAMSMKALGPHFDIHTGGIDHISIHHTNEIAQSEAATDETFANYWIHHAFLTVDGQKMSKSLGNFYTVEDVKAKGFDPMALRYLYLQTHYRQEMNFTWESLDAAQTALNKLRRYFLDSKEGSSKLPATFEEALNEDLNISKALAIVWENSSHLSRTDFEKIDDVFGLELMRYKERKIEIPAAVQELLEKREEARKNKDFDRSDELRNQISNLGFEVMDTPSGQQVRIASK